MSRTVSALSTAAGISSPQWSDDKSAYPESHVQKLPFDAVATDSDEQPMI